MGLDVVGLSRIRLVGQPVDGGCEDVGCYNLRVNSDFPDHANGVESGCYRTDDEVVQGGSWSYSGYNRWREALAAMALGVTPWTVWNEGTPYDGPYAGKPFVELIHFSDCEGIIGPRTAKKLAADFADWNDRAKVALDEWDYHRYVTMREAMEAAADDGAVEFT